MLACALTFFGAYLAGAAIMRKNYVACGIGLLSALAGLTIITSLFP
jgi:hypothetical protein